MSVFFGTQTETECCRAAIGQKSTIKVARMTYLTEYIYIYIYFFFIIDHWCPFLKKKVIRQHEIIKMMTEFYVLVNNLLRRNKESQKKSWINWPHWMASLSWWTFPVPYFLNRLGLIQDHPQRSVPTWSHARQYPSVSFWHTEHRLSELHFPPTTESIQNQHFRRGGETYISALRVWGNAGIVWIMPQNHKSRILRYTTPEHQRNIVTISTK